MEFEYYINLDERGEFYADVRRASDEKTVFEINGLDVFEDGWMTHRDDIDGLKAMLVDLSILPIACELVKGN